MPGAGEETRLVAYVVPRQEAPPVKDDGDAEASDVVEPLVVDRSPYLPAPTAEPPRAEETIWPSSSSGSKSPFR